MSAQHQTLDQLFAALHAERVRTWAPAALQKNVDQRRRLVETSDRNAFVKAGDKVASFVLVEADGGRVDLDRLLAAGPVVLVFFRFAGCPACNIALPYYQRTLQPGLKAAGATLVALSPQTPERLKDIKDRNSLDFLVASDRDNALAHAFGIVFEPDAGSKAASLAAGSFIGDVTGTGSWELPMPAVVVIGQDRTVRFADVSPDWLDRTEAAPILAAVDALLLSKVA